MKEIPIPLVKANQAFLAISTLLAIVLQNQWILLGAFLVVLLPLLFGPKANLIFKAARPLLRQQLTQFGTEDVRLQQFNQRIAVMLLGLGVAVLFLGGHWSGYLFAGMVTVASGAALAGYCIGCVLYFQWKQWRYKVSK